MAMATDAELDTLLLRLPDELVDLQRDSRGQSVFKHPLNQLARIERHIIRCPQRTRNFLKRRREQNLPSFSLQPVFANKLTRKLIIRAIADDKLYLIVLRQRFEILHPEAVRRRTRSRTLHINDLVDLLRNVRQRPFTRSLDHQRITL